jgi:hypothetical protein
VEIGYPKEEGYGVISMNGSRSEDAEVDGDTISFSSSSFPGRNTDLPHYPGLILLTEEGRRLEIGRGLGGRQIPLRFQAHFQGPFHRRPA